MKKKLEKTVLNLKSNKGATFAEYAISLAGLIAVFVIIGILIQAMAVNLAERSVESVKYDVPCRSYEKPAAVGGDPEGGGPDSNILLTGEECL